MEIWIAILISLGVLMSLIVMGMPIAFAIALAGCTGIILLADVGTLFYTLGSFPASRLASYTWAALPLFIFLGNLIEASGVAQNAYEVAYKFSSKIPGGLAVATVIASGVVAATTGSGATSICIFGKVAVPQMERLGYKRSLALGATTASGPLGVLIPPSLAFIIVGMLAEVSIGKMFIAGIIPGIITVALFSLMIITRCMLNPRLAPRSPGFSWKERISSLPKISGVAILFIVILGGLYTGVATVIEVAALGALIALVLVLIAIMQKKSTWRALGNSVVESIGVSSMIFAFIISAGLFSLFITLTGVVQDTVVFIQSSGLPINVILAFVVCIFFVMGMFFDPTSMIVLGVPVFYPVLVGGLGVDPVWLAVIVVIMSEVGSLTPPVGMAFFTMKAVYPRAPLMEIVQGCIPFIIVNLVVIALLFIFPQLATWLPGMMWS